MCWGTNLLGQCPASIHSSQNLQALHALGRGRRMVCLLPRLPWVLRQVFSRATDCTPLLCSARSWCPEHPSEMASVGLGVPRAICRVPALPCSLALLLPWMVSVWPQMPAGVSCQSFTWSQAPKGKCPFFFFISFILNFWPGSLHTPHCSPAVTEGSRISSAGALPAVCHATYRCPWGKVCFSFSSLSAWLSLVCLPASTVTPPRSPAFV